MNTTRQGDITGFDDAEVVDEEQEEDNSQTETILLKGEHMTCNDCIHIAVCYRQGAVDLNYADKCGDFQIPDNATNAEWVDQYNDGNWHCSKCGAIVEKDEQINHNWYFCYHCGKKMNSPYQKGDSEQ